jgi:hypothetical protein
MYIQGGIGRKCNKISGINDLENLDMAKISLLKDLTLKSLLSMSWLECFVLNPLESVSRVSGCLANALSAKDLPAKYWELRS